MRTQSQDRAYSLVDAAPVVLRHRDVLGKCSVLERAHADFYANEASGLQALQELQRLMERHQSGGGSQTLCIPARSAEGFGIVLYTDAAGVHGWFGGLEQEFLSLTEGFGAARNALSIACRLRITKINGRSVEWILEDQRLGYQAVMASSVGTRSVTKGVAVHEFKRNDLFRSRVNHEMDADGLRRN